MSREAYKLAVGFFLDTVAAVNPGQWEQHALGVWNVRDLVGHTARSITNVELYATVGASGRTVGSEDDIAERGREAGRQLGENPASAVREFSGQVLPYIDGLTDNHVLDTAIGKISLIDYLPSRVQELTTHSIDIARAIGLDATPPDECLRVSLYWYVDQSIRRGKGSQVAMALTGRESLPEGFNVFA